VLIAGLIGLNVVLAILLAAKWRGRTAAVSGPPSPAVPAVQVAPVPAPVAPPPGTTPTASAKPTWQALDAADLRRFIANLRAVGCPEQTIQDIILARVNQQFAAREAALKLRPEHLKPWEASAWTEKAQRDRQRQLADLGREKRALLKELLDLDVPVEVPEFYASRDAPRYEAAYAALPEAKRTQARQIQESFWDQLEDLEQRTRGFWEREDREEYKRLRAERDRALAGLLTADELEKFELATSDTAQALRFELAGFNATDQEFRDIFRLRKPLEDRFDEGPESMLGPGDDDLSVERDRAFEQYETQLKELLGDERYADLQRSKDFQYRNLARVAQENGLDRNTTIRAYETHTAARAEAARVRMDATLSGEQRQAALKAMQAELDRTMLQLLGERGFQSWQGSVGARIYLESRLPVVPPPPPSQP
jgi:hypothetical protein